MKIGIAGPILTRMFHEYLDLQEENYPKGLGGSAVIELSLELLRKGYEVSIYTLDPSVDESMVLRGRNLTVYFGKFRRDKIMHNFMRNEIELIRGFILKDKPDIVNAHWSYEYSIGAIKSKVPALHTVRDWSPKILRISKTPYRVGRMMMQFYSLLAGKNFSAVSPYIYDKVKFIVKRVEVIPNSLPAGSLLMEEKHLKPEPVILSFGDGLRGGKNIIVSILAFQKIRRRIKGAKLMLLGPNLSPDSETALYIKELGLDDVTLLGKVSYEEALKIYKTADLLIHPSKEESFGNTIIEAMANKVPVVGGKNSGAVPWLLGSGQYGLLADINDPDDVAKQALTVLENKELWIKYSSAGFENVRNNFMIPDIADKYLDYYTRILNDKTHNE